MSAQTMSVEQAKKALREARLNEHKDKIRNALTKNDNKALAEACGSFASLFRNKSKAKA